MIPADEHAPLLVPAEEIRRRLTALQHRLGERGVDGVWIEHLADRLYLSGSAQNGVVFVPAAGDAIFWVRKSLSRAEAESPLLARAHPGRRELGRWLREKHGVRRLGVAADVMPASHYLALGEQLPGVELVDVAAVVRRLRATKSPWEIEQIRVASDQYTTLLDEIRDSIRPGTTELALTGLIEGRLRELGHGGTVRVRRPGADISMATVVSGRSALYPTAFDGPVGAPGASPAASSGAGRKRLCAGETVMLDIVTSHNGYHADTTRTFFLGDHPPSSTVAAHLFCREVLAEIEARLRPDAVCSEIYREVARLAADRGEPEGFMGYAENRVRFFGHGVGLELDELPVLADKVDLALEVGMVLAVEPKAFDEPVGAVGVEDTYVVTARGCEPMCPASRELVCL